MKMENMNPCIAFASNRWQALHLGSRRRKAMVEHGKASATSGKPRVANGKLILFALFNFFGAAQVSRIIKVKK